MLIILSEQWLFIFEVFKKRSAIIRYRLYKIQLIEGSFSDQTALLSDVNIIIVRLYRMLLKRINRFG
jgi:hypothetical protein